VSMQADGKRKLAIRVAVRWAPLLLALGVACELGGCASASAARERDLAELVARLPADYDNAAQAQADAAAAVSPAHAALHLTITNISVPMVSEYVVHVRETAVGDPRRIVAQSIWTFSLVGDQLVQSSFQFQEPERWRSGDPAVFRALLPRDLRVQAGCELHWSRSGTDFNASGIAGHCRDSLAAADGGGFIVEQLQLHGADLAIARQRFASNGEKLAAAEADPWYRFRRSR
jgi:CpeT/CpcT family (DUF1001)